MLFLSNYSISCCIVFRIGSFKISNSTYIVCTTMLDITGLIAILLGIEFAGSGLFQGTIGLILLIVNGFIVSAYARAQRLGAHVTLAALSFPRPAAPM